MDYIASMSNTDPPSGQSLIISDEMSSSRGLEFLDVPVAQRKGQVNQTERAKISGGNGARPEEMVYIHYSTMHQRWPAGIMLL